MKGVDIVEARRPAAELNGFIKRFKSIGIDGSGLSYRDFMLISSNIVRQRFHLMDEHLLRLRAVKDRHEMDCIKRASESSGKALTALLGRITSDMTEKQVAAQLDLELVNAGADGISFDTVVAFDERAAYAHAIPSNDRKLGGKKLMLCDFGSLYRGYHSDETHTFFIKGWDSDAKRVYGAVLEAHDRAIDAARVGVRASALDRVARDFLDRKGYGRYFGHALGHGVGLDVHESPSIQYSSKDVLKSGMVFTIEPGVYIPGWGGVRIESMVCLLGKGKEVLTRRSGPIVSLEA
ncbi:MAG: M24 family metallopeptidase [Deltaproteobacteria bacterium]|nr:M24 family metallopeptidase [Deltaproteobacteria bacterium]